MEYAEADRADSSNNKVGHAVLRGVDSIHPIRSFLRFAPFLTKPAQADQEARTSAGKPQKANGSVSAMKYRRLGRTELMVSQVGFGTCQLRMTSHQQALDTLRCGFELGVNIVHTAADYGGAIETVAEAIRTAPQPVYVCSNGWGALNSFEAQFEQSLALFGRRDASGKMRLDMFGIASVEDRLVLGDDVWGDQGQVPFLQRKKRQGVLRNIFCTTHGSPSFIADLIRGGAFDAVMFAYNALGHHALSYRTPAGREHEDLAGNGSLFELAAEHDVGVLLMEVLGGGLLCESKAFGDRVRGLVEAPAPAAPKPCASELLTHLLRTRPQAASLLPGTASVAEAQENALAGHQPNENTDHGTPPHLQVALDAMRSTLCTRCGACEPLCSKQLPVSWMFRASDIERTGAMTFETPLGHHYFDLHPESEVAMCSTCDQRTCRCPTDIDIPGQLTKRHAEMMALRRLGLTPGATRSFNPAAAPQWAVQLMTRTVEGGVLRIALRNLGWHGWHRDMTYPQVRVLCRYRSGTVATLELGDDVPAGSVMHCGVALPVDIPADQVSLFLDIRSRDGGRVELEIHEGSE
ncbi:aldo/keto reductase [Variovorax rhizosphaerae]|uniref:Aldo/keto reductase n=1 Tax=Variovorax rhizosphaerae TaxID=1836200 RepID=A0ABU8WHT9_9BURK